MNRADRRTDVSRVEWNTHGDNDAVSYYSMWSMFVAGAMLWGNKS